MDEFLYSRFPDSAAGPAIGLRLLAAHLWVRLHHQELDLPDVGVVGAGVVAITGHTAVALYRVFAAMPHERVGRDFPASVVVPLAQEHARINPPTA